VKYVSGKVAASSALRPSGTGRHCASGAAVFGIAAALHQRAYQVALLEVTAFQVAVDDLTRHFQAGQVGGAGRHRVFTHALQHVGPVDAGGVDLDEHFAGPQGRRRALAQLQDFRLAGLGDLDGAHG
jgi:hypothetical protein